MTTEASNEFEILDDPQGGAYHVVYRARETRLNRQVALKFLTSSYIGQKDVLQEARALAAHPHPNLVTIHRVTSMRHPSSGLPAEAIVMEYLHGQSLHDFLTHVVPISTAISIGRALISAVSHLHSHGITHCDLHAENILICDGDLPKIIDPNDPVSLSTMTTMSRSARIELDALALGVVLSQLLRASDLPFDIAMQHVERVRPLRSLSEISQEFLAMTQDDAGTGNSQSSPSLPKPSLRKPVYERPEVSGVLRQHSVLWEERRAASLPMACLVFVACPVKIGEASANAQDLSELLPGGALQLDHDHGTFPLVRHYHADAPLYRRTPDGFFGKLPVRDEPPSELWQVARTGAFAYRTSLWEDDPRQSRAPGNLDIEHCLELLTIWTAWIRRMSELWGDLHGSQYLFQMGGVGFAGRRLLYGRAFSARPRQPLETDTFWTPVQEGSALAIKSGWREFVIGTGLELAHIFNQDMMDSAFLSARLSDILKNNPFLERIHG